MLIRYSIQLLPLLFAPIIALAAPTTPDQDFIDNQNGTVLHKVTGITWKRCAEGQNWENNTCTGTAALYTHPQALALSSNFANKSNWRLPTIAELDSIVERDKHSPAINTAIFPNTPQSQFWSSTINATYSTYAWFTHFLYGYDNYNATSDTLSVRLVRGGPRLTGSGEYTPAAAFTAHGNGTVTHKITGLMWQQCVVGQTWKNNSCSGSGTTFSTYDSAVNVNNHVAGYGDWRLPTPNELKTILEYKNANPAINSAIFSNTPYSDGFGTASLYAYDTNLMWRLSFLDGRDSSTEKTSNVVVRLVRGKWEYPNAIYDDSTKLVTFQDVIVGEQRYFVQLELRNDGLFGLKNAQPLTEAQHYLPAQYDFANEKLHIPRVQALGSNFRVVLKNVGNYVFAFDQIDEVQ